MERKILIEVSEEEYEKIKVGGLERTIDLKTLDTSTLIGELRDRRKSELKVSRFYDDVSRKSVSLTEFEVECNETKRVTVYIKEER